MSDDGRPSDPGPAIVRFVVMPKEGSITKMLQPVLEEHARSDDQVMMPFAKEHIIKGDMG